MNSGPTDDQLLRHLHALSLTHGASLADVRRAYRDLVKVWHPDRFGGDPRLQERAESEFKKINAAHAWLCDHSDWPARQPNVAETNRHASSEQPARGRWVNDAPPSRTASDAATQPKGSDPSAAWIGLKFFVAYFAFVAALSIPIALIYQPRPTTGAFRIFFFGALSWFWRAAANRRAGWAFFAWYILACTAVVSALILTETL